MATAISLVVRRQYTRTGYKNFVQPTGTAKTVVVPIATGDWRVQSFSDPDDTSIYSVFIRPLPDSGKDEQFYCSQTAAAILALAVA